MDPRHPELAISRLRELMYQYNEIENGMKHATTSAQLAQLEHEGALVVQEICLVAPRIHEAMMQTSRQRRYDLAHGVVEKPVMVKLERPLTEEEGKKIVESISADKSDEPVEKPAHKWSSAEKVVEAKEYLEQTIANSDVEKPVEKSMSLDEMVETFIDPVPIPAVEKSAQSVTKQPTEPTQSVKKTEVKPKKKTTKKKAE